MNASPGGRPGGVPAAGHIGPWTGIMVPVFFTTNLYSGGYTCPLDHFLEREFAGQAFDIARYLEQFGLHLARHMDTLYDDPLDELGIDIALDEQRVARLFEVNWKPGPPPMWYLELDHARNVVAYAAFLARQAATRRA